MILPPQDFAPCGFVVKHHGKQGALKCVFYLFFQPDFEAGDWLFLSINRKPVPFFIEAIDYPGDLQPVIKLTGIKSPEQARKYRNHQLLYPRESLQEADTEKQPLIGLEGMTVFDQQSHSRGTIIDAEALDDQLILTIQPTDGSEAFQAPCHPELVMAIDWLENWIRMTLAPGIESI